MAQWRMIARDGADMLGEGTIWSARDDAVYWVDILAPALNRLSLKDGAVERWAVPEPLGWVAERAGGGFIGGFKSGFAEISLDPLTITPIGDPEPDLPGNRMNDGKADAQGQIWCGTMDMAEESDSGSLYRLTPDLVWQQMDTGYRVPNGPAFSHCGKWLYHSDTARRIMYRFARTADGIANRQPFISFTDADGYPDGMTVDADGHIWVAHWGGGRISRFTPDGKLDRAIALPARQVTNICFAGPDLDRMFVSSAAIGLDATPCDGGLFEVDCGVRGLQTHLFAG
ncbi:MAG: SMP-30/gluconolactonase/LRE family protein [Sphingobium sp.]|jgi:D-xylonolactonase|uniref:SMP-30/gluconolactonase/LRE family protein n=2 Tax=Sphingobium sp. TaxID=1912891 RepID=UPI000C4A32BF|nr:SMP-30/gluconolactonase/LRE family protein [Sphingobium sp.]MBU0657266.1 SMP-30/gluconolactonase/LRE family protein [Alphaproteobacteria bacterium]MBA4755140.1 SMP-30/gluconolactonase/LRE family protein [Sphingobium sp.]MBS90268.1 gluconolaconase [Sphingobium sp.]MBU0774840.1 SMP-30/gluconolactonase/LRE family protein [Alphaproteobacteria bacterium]MBU0866621.1 SMP-30/gluconolactonase/LRE family protein [Alphaproteobacteria bacterium]